MVSVSVYVVILIKKMPSSPRSYLSWHTRPGIRPFSDAEVALVSASMRHYKELRSNRNIARVRRVLGRLFSMHFSDSRLNRIIRGLSDCNVFSRAYAHQIAQNLEYYRQQFTPVYSDHSDDEM